MSDYSDNEDNYNSNTNLIDNKLDNKLDIDDKYNSIVLIPKYRNELEIMWNEYVYDSIYDDIISLLEYYLAKYFNSGVLNFIDESEYNKLFEIICHHLEPKYNYQHILQDKKKMNDIQRIINNYKSYQNKKIKLIQNN